MQACLCLALLETSESFSHNRAQILNDVRNSILGLSAIVKSCTLVRQASSFKDSDLINPSTLDLRTGIHLSKSIKNILQ